jgi:glycosyltransferase involved in cell wall biosynthesis
MARIFAGARKESDGELWLVGAGEGLPTVKSILRRAGLTDDLHQLGLRLDLEAILPQADVLLVTSRTESFCLAALEAASCGLPVVAPRVGGLPDVVADGVTGMLHERGDDAEAIRALVQLLGDEELRRRMGEAAMARAADFAAEAVVPRYERLYAELAEGRRAIEPEPAVSLQA